jgi:PAS domain S-box-containing protein
MDAEIGSYCRQALTSDDPAVFREDADRPVLGRLSQEFGVRSTMVLALRPRIGKPWMFALHQCSYAREWTLEEQRLFKEIGRRLEDSLSLLLMLRNLRTSEERLDLAVRGSNDGLWDWSNVNKQSMWWSPRTYEMLGYDESFVQPTFAALLEKAHPEDQDAVKSAVRDHLRSQEALDVEFRLRGRLDEYRWIRVRGKVVRGDGDQVTRTSGPLQDITEQKLATERLRRSEERYRLIADNMTDLVAMSDEEGNFAYVSPSYERVLGYGPDTLLGKPIYELVHRDDLPDILSLIEERRKDFQPAAARYRMRHQNGEYLWFETHGRVIFDEEGRNKGAVFNTRDITENRRLETELRQAHKMEAIGTLAGGIAHDFNNILGIILGNSELAIQDMPESHRARQNLVEVREACERAKDMVARILTFSRRTEHKRKPVRMRRIVEDSLRLLRSSIPTTIEIRARFSNSRDTILADPTQINQILINLCSNASYAMRDTGGVIEIAMRNVEYEQNAPGLDGNPGPGAYLLLAVRDTGRGMAPEVLRRVFDPYFTTKERGQGTGMGLSVVHGIVTSHEGAIRVQSEPGDGTVFEICFPLIEEGGAAEEEVSAALPSGRERILLVDDEAALLDVGQRMLHHLGYQVTTKANSLEALEAFRAEPDGFDVVMTDMTMPLMTGGELARELLQIRPDVSIILCTGFSEVITEERAREMGVRAFVMKPFALREIAQIVRRVLDEK